jgi:creatinine amidohydrolase/Fe(II)-dependent formamide hydrolase-like protein
MLGENPMMRSWLSRLALTFQIAPHALTTTMAALLLMVPLPARAQAPATVFLEELTWTELRDLVAAGKTTILVPIGGTEQNGPQMVLGKHNFRARALAAKIALQLGSALVAPEIAYVPEGDLDPPTGHMRFPGTITVPHEVLAKLLEYAARSLRLSGFRDICFLEDSGGYEKDLEAVADRLNREWAATPVRVHAIMEYYRAAQTDYVQALKGRGYTDAEIGTHAGLADTSLLLAVDPRLVRIDRLDEAVRRGRAGGAYGDPRRASAELGQLGIDAIVAQTVAAIRKHVANR